MYCRQCFEYVLFAKSVSINFLGHFFAFQPNFSLGSLAGHIPTILTAASLPTVISTAAGVTSAAPMQSSAANQPCTTLFVANLGPTVNEQELREIFGSFPGFCRLRMHNKNGSPVAFIEYFVSHFDSLSMSKDLCQATQAMTTLQGFVLLSSDRGGIRIEYAKHKMGEVRLYMRVFFGLSKFTLAAKGRQL
ncbi:unnamed protein product [Soboliphyme baturini]|uniref:RRM domain-containing protein n=1 Tax=Soboliphyme baturini TaxID=241478 RepID=A0A3P7ZJM5_9BILA|nr:unnamed protein product [Soboliphyme baturini]